MEHIDRQSLTHLKGAQRARIFYVKFWEDISEVRLLIPFILRGEDLS